MFKRRKKKLIVLALGLCLCCAAALAADLALQELDLEIGPDAVTQATPGYKRGYKPSHLREAKRRPPFLVVPGLENVALYKPVTASEPPVVGELEQLNDDIKTSADFDVVEGPRWVQVDLEEPVAIHAIVLWHFYKNATIYDDVIVQVSDNPDFSSNVTTLFNNDRDNSSKLGRGRDTAYYSRWWGEIVDARGERNAGMLARYVRVHTARSVMGNRPRYVEIAVYGKKPEPPSRSNSKALPFFALCMDVADSKKRSLRQQAELLKELGYDGAGHLWLDGVEERLKTLDDAGLELYQIYMRVNVAPGNQRPYDSRLKEILPLLKGRPAALVLLMSGLGASDVAGDPRAVEVVREIAAMAEDSKTRVILYPHAGDWLERVEDAIRVADKIDRPNVGVMFNLCHWLKVDEEKNLEPLLKAAMPRLFAISVNGADNAAEIRAGKGNWIQPLDSGSFDQYALFKTLHGLGYAGPVGLQCYGIPGDARDHLERSMSAWRKFRTRLTLEPKLPNSVGSRVAHQK